MASEYIFHEKAPRRQTSLTLRPSLFTFAEFKAHAPQKLNHVCGKYGATYNSLIESSTWLNQEQSRDQLILSVEQNEY